MIDFIVHWVDVSEHVRSGTQPVFTIDREPPAIEAPGGNFKRDSKEPFWVPTRPVMEEDPKWSMTRSEKYVRVPMHAYRTHSYAHAAILGLGIELATRALTSLVQHKSETPSKVIVVIGHDVDTVFDQFDGSSHFRVYVGFVLVS